MQTILTKTSYEEMVKNSKFISIIIPIKEENDVKKELLKIKETYKNATHYCYAYRFTSKKGFSDDGEPNKTAGLPILTILEKEDLINILVIVVRYFGGIKLGPGGLIRAYTKLTKEVINKSSKTSLTTGYEVTISFPYAKEKEINYLLKDFTIINKSYTTACFYTVNIPKEFLNRLTPLVEIIAKKEKLIPKRD